MEGINPITPFPSSKVYNLAGSDLSLWSGDSWSKSLFIISIIFFLLTTNSSDHMPVPSNGINSINLTTHPVSLENLTKCGISSSFHPLIITVLIFTGKFSSIAVFIAFLTL